MSVMFKKDRKEISLDEVISFLKSKFSESGVDIEVHAGRKYFKIVKHRSGERYVYFFVDKAGNIYKPASWSSPAKHVRGTLFDRCFSWGRALGPYGVSYLK